MLFVLLLDVLVFIHHWMDVFHERLSEHCNIFVFVVNFLLVVVRRAEPFPRKSVNEKRVFLEVLFQSVFLRDNPGIVVVYVDVVTVGQVAGAVVVAGSEDRARRFRVSVLDVVELLVGEVVEGEVSVRAGGIHGTPLPRAKT